MLFIISKNKIYKFNRYRYSCNIPVRTHDQITNGKAATIESCTNANIPSFFLLYYTFLITA